MNPYRVIKLRTSPPEVDFYEKITGIFMSWLDSTLLKDSVHCHSFSVRYLTEKWNETHPTEGPMTEALMQRVMNLLVEVKKMEPNEYPGDFLQYYRKVRVKK